MGEILKKIFLSSKKSIFEVSLRKWWVFRNLDIKFRIIATELSIFSNLREGAIALFAHLGCATVAETS